MQNRQQHDHRPILRMSFNEAPMILSFTSWVIYVLIGCRHPVIRYWLPLLAKTTTTGSLPHPENEHQWSVNTFSCCILGSKGIARSFAFKMELLTTMIRQNTTYQR